VQNKQPMLTSAKTGTPLYIHETGDSGKANLDKAYAALMGE
jgi:hypothetical protein